MAAPRFAQAPRFHAMGYADALPATIFEGDVAAGIRIDMIRIYAPAGTAAVDVAIYLTDNELGGGLSDRMIDLITPVNDEFVTRRYDWLVVPDGKFLRGGLTGDPAPGAVTVQVFGAELG